MNYYMCDDIMQYAMPVFLNLMINGSMEYINLSWIKYNIYLSQIKYNIYNNIINDHFFGKKNLKVYFAYIDNDIFFLC